MVRKLALLVFVTVLGLSTINSASAQFIKIPKKPENLIPRKPEDVFPGLPKPIPPQWRLPNSSGETGSQLPVLDTQTPAKPLARIQFRYQGGEFLKGANGEWTENRKNGPNSEFRETKRTTDVVELYDSSRRLYVRLSATGATAWTGQNWAPWEGSNGYWSK